MDLTKKAKRGDIFYKNGQLFTEWPSGFDRFTGRGDEEKATPLQAILDGFGAKLYVAPVYDPATHALDGVIVENADHVTEGVRGLTSLEIGDRVLGEILAAIDSELEAVRHHIDGTLFAEGKILVERVVNVEKKTDLEAPKSHAVYQWARGLWDQVYVDVDRIKQGLEPLLDVAALPDKPFTAQQVKDEAAGLGIY